MAEFGNQSGDWLRKWLEVPSGIPCDNTFSQIFQALHGSRSGNTSHFNAVSAWASEAGIFLAQAFVGERINEIAAIPQLLEMLNHKGAMGTQRAIAGMIVTKGGPSSSVLRTTKAASMTRSRTSPTSPPASKIPRIWIRNEDAGHERSQPLNHASDGT